MRLFRATLVAFLVLSGSVLASGKIMARSRRVHQSVPDGPTSIVEDGSGRLFFAIGGSQGCLLVWDGKTFRERARGNVGGVGVARDASIWYTLRRRIKTLGHCESSAAVDQTAVFGGKVGDGSPVFAGRLGDVWVEGCPKVRAMDGTFVPSPRCPVRGPSPVPGVEDRYGNRWGLVRVNGKGQETHVVVLSAGRPDEWKVLGADDGFQAGQWELLITDEFGFIWIGGSQGVTRFDPRQVGRGWNPFSKEHLVKRTVTAFGIAPHGSVLAGFADGSVLELGVRDDKEWSNRIEVQQAADTVVRAVHTDKTGAVWVVAGGAIYRNEPAPDAWQRDWKPMASMPLANHDICGAILNGKLYIGGGITDYGYPVKMLGLDSLWAYESEKDQWEPLEPMSARRGYCGIAAFNSEIWVLGGFLVDEQSRRTITDMVEVYNPRTRQWRPGPALDMPRAEPVVLTVDDRLYVFGGAGADDKATRSVVSRAIGQQNWRREPDAPVPLRQTSGCVLNGKVYIAPGRDAKLPESPGLFVYNPSRAVWENDVPRMPVETTNAPLTAAYKGSVWVIGCSDDKIGRKTHHYSPETKTWKCGPNMPTPLSWGAGAQMNGRLIIAGGAYFSSENGHYIFSERTLMLRVQ